MTATTSEPIYLGSGPRPPSYRIPVERVLAHHDDAGRSGPARSVTAHAAAGNARVDVSRAKPGRWRSALMDSAELLALVWSIPFAMLLVGAPVALTIVLVVWLGRLALNAF